LLISADVYSRQSSKWVDDAREHAKSFGGYDLITVKAIGAWTMKTDLTPGRTDYELCIAHKGEFISKLFGLLSMEGILAIYSYSIDVRWQDDLKAKGYDVVCPNSPEIFMLTKHEGDSNLLPLPVYCNRG
jgi:hypothetical protein